MDFQPVPLLLVLLIMKLNAKQLRTSNEQNAKQLQQNIHRNQLVIVLDRVYDTFNIGSFFRLADALGLEKLYLCGPVVTPPNLKIHRASIGTWKWVPWEHSYSTTQVVKHLKANGYELVGCEQNRTSKVYYDTKYSKKIALVLGNETDGISPEVSALLDQTIEIPMFGVNRSMNVLVAGSILSNHIVQSWNKK